jgi:hypothetical protein
LDSLVLNLGELYFGQPFLVGTTWNVKIYKGFDVEGAPILEQTIEIEIPQEDVQAANGGPFYWGKVMLYIARKAKKTLCPSCT